MTNCYRVTGFIFKKEDRSEADRLFFIFTDSLGKLKVFGKAIRKISSKLKSGIDLFCISEIEFIQGKSKKTLTDAVIVKKYDNIIRSPRRFEIANQIIRVIDDFIKEQEPDEFFFDLLKDSFEKLDNRNKGLTSHQFHHLPR